MERARGRIARLPVIGLCLGLGACGVPHGGAGFDALPTRGYVLVSIDTLRADHLGAYGHARPISPFFDRLAARGVLFENATAPYPSTLVSHMSMFTGLYPAQHGVYPPAVVLPERIATLPQRFRDAGYRTEAHTEGGFVGWGFGFERGFEVYDDTDYAADTDVEGTFARGLRFLRGLQPGERFFLFLHTYSVHDPYDPPAEHLTALGESASGPDSGGARIRRFNQGREAIEAAEVERFARRYEASVRYVDTVLASFVGGLEELGLMDETTLVVTSDHGEEFLEHGRLGHTQLFPESLRVPLLVVHPDQPSAARVADTVGLVDVAPTLVDLAGLPPLEGAAGRSLAPYLRDPGLRRDALGYAELTVEDQAGLVADPPYRRTLVGALDGGRYQLLVEQVKADAEGTWIERRAELDHFGGRLALRGRSYREPRRVTVRSDGREVATLDVGPQWAEFVVELPDEGLQRLELEADGCLRPVDVGDGGDGRCLSVLVDGPPVATAVLFDLDGDPGATTDVARRHPLVVRRLMRELQERQWTTVGGVETRELSAEDRKRLRALGYLD